MQTQQIRVEAGERIGLPDTLKGVAVILMVQVHLMELFANELTYNSMFGKISLFLGGPPAAPVFMAVMGYFMAHSNKHLPESLWRGLKLILLGIIVNIGMNANLLFKTFQGNLDINPWQYIFGVDILFLAGLSIILISLLKLVFNEKLLLWLLSILVFGGLNRFLPEYSGESQLLKYLLPYFSGFCTWSYFPVFPWMTYVLVGFTFRLAVKKNLLPALSSKTTTYIFAALILLLAVTFGFGLSISSVLDDYYHHTIVFVIWTMAFLAFWLILFTYLDQFFGKSEVFVYLRWVGKNVTVFYVVQWLIIGNIATEVYRTQPLFQLILWFAAIMLVTSAMVYGISRTKLSF
jgi:uncharacterized membrane protein